MPFFNLIFEELIPGFAKSGFKKFKFISLNPSLKKIYLGANTQFQLFI